MVPDRDKPPPPDEPVTTHDWLLRAIAHPSARAVPKSEPDPTRLAHFRIVRRLGAGGMGVVYLATDEKLQRNIALKVLPSALEADPGRRRRFLREARSAAAITHPNIAAVYEVGEAEGRVFIAMELVEGETLRSRITRGRLPLAEALAIARQLLDALSRAHDKGVVHCDLKPDNVMIDTRGHAKVLDFGLATLREGEREASTPGDLGLAETALSPTEEGHVIGTPGYMAPEQANGMALDARADIFAFGVMLYEMLAGLRPFKGKTTFAILVAVDRDPVPPLRVHNPDVPAALQAVVARCLAKPREERYAAAREVLDALARIGPGAGMGARVWRWLGGGPKRWWALGPALVAILVAALGARAVVASRDKAAHAAASSAASAVPVTPPAIGLLDHPPPATRSPEAAAAYRRALTDVRDAVRPPQTSLQRAVQIDPEFAAAHLRLSMVRLPPGSTSEYGEALRFRASLDTRDQELLHAEEPIAAESPPDLVAGERRYVALHEARPRDVEILMRLAAIRDRRDPASARATFRKLLQLAPAMAGAELAAADNAKEGDDPDDANAHYQRCLELSPMAARCLARLAHLQATSGRCDVYAREVTRILELEPDDSFFRTDGLSAALTKGGSEDDVRDAMAGVLRTSSQSQGRSEERLEGEVALWRGQMLEARSAFNRAAERFSHDAAMSSALTVTFPQRLTIAEELGDEDEVRRLTRAYIGARALTTDGDYDDRTLTALRRHHVLPTDEILRLRDQWRNDIAGGPPALVWLRYDAGLALTEEEAREALASGYDAEISHDALDVNALLGHVLLLAHRFADAASRLRLVAFNCALFWGDASYVPLIVPGAYDLGQALEGMGAVDQACAVYQHVLDRWGKAAPRSTTAQAARTRWRALHCAIAN